MYRILWLTTILVLGVAQPAAAGGSWLEADTTAAAPGDVVTLAGTVGRGQLGWIEDGPFLVALRPHEVDAVWQAVHPDDVVVGTLELEPTTGLTLAASLRFTVPDVAPGRYGYRYCNRPCTTGVGDLIGVRDDLHVVDTTGELPRTGGGGAVLAGAALTLAVALRRGGRARSRPRR